MAVRSHDGVGVVARGDLLLILYGADARLHRTRWLFDQADELVGRHPGGALALMVITAQAGLPDAPTPAENARRLDKLGDGLRRLVTVPLGDSVRASLVRAVMRAMFLLHGKSDRLRIANGETEGIREILVARRRSRRARPRSARICPTSTGRSIRRGLDGSLAGLTPRTTALRV